MAIGLLIQNTHAASIDHSVHKYGVCKSFNLPITATAPSGVYEMPNVNNDIQATNWTLWNDRKHSQHIWITSKPY